MVDRIDETYEIDSMICIPVWKGNQRSGEVEIAGVLQCLNKIEGSNFIGADVKTAEDFSLHINDCILPSDVTSSKLPEYAAKINEWRKIKTQQLANDKLRFTYLENLAQECTEFVGADTTSLFFIEEDSSALRCPAGHGMPTFYINTDEKHLLGLIDGNLTYDNILGDESENEVLRVASVIIREIV